jgi:hypothetical protein
MVAISSNIYKQYYENITDLQCCLNSKDIKRLQLIRFLHTTLHKHLSIYFMENPTR